MELSKFQNDLVLDIANQRILHINTLLDQYGDLESISTINRDFNRATIKQRVINDRNQIVFVPRNEMHTKSVIIEYIALIKLLERAELIIQVPFNVNGVVYPLARKVSDGETFHLEHDRIIQGLIASIDEIEIYPLPSLGIFIENDYRTEKEITDLENQKRYLNESKDRKTSQILTYILAILSIVISIATAIFNYYTYDKQRNVTITNPEAFKDTTKVLIVNSSKTDSIFVSNPKPFLKNK